MRIIGLPRCRQRPSTPSLQSGASSFGRVWQHSPAILPGSSTAVRATAVSSPMLALAASTQRGSKSLRRQSSARTRAMEASTFGGTRSKNFPGPSSPRPGTSSFRSRLIEHLLEPRALLRGAHSALVPGGALALSTPYHGLVKNLAIAAFRFDSHFGVDGEHVRFFTDTSLTRLLEESGFEVVEIVHLGRHAPLWANTLAWARKA